MHWSYSKEKLILVVEFLAVQVRMFLLFGLYFCYFVPPYVEPLVTFSSNHPHTQSCHCSPLPMSGYKRKSLIETKTKPAKVLLVLTRIFTTRFWVHFVDSFKENNNRIASFHHEILELMNPRTFTRAFFVPHYPHPSNFPPFARLYCTSRPRECVPDKTDE